MIGLLLSAVAKGEDIADMIVNCEITNGRFNRDLTNVTVCVTFSPKDNVDANLLLERCQKELYAYISVDDGIGIYYHCGDDEVEEVNWSVTDGNVQAEITFEVTFHGEERFADDFLFIIGFNWIESANMGRLKIKKHHDGTCEGEVVFGDYDDIVIDRVVSADKWLSIKHLWFEHDFVVRFEYDLSAINDALWGRNAGDVFKAVVVYMQTNLCAETIAEEALFAKGSFDWRVGWWQTGEYAVGFLPEEFIVDGLIDKERLGVRNLTDLSALGFFMVTLSDICAHNVTFEVGDVGEYLGGGELSQTVTDGQSAIAPKVLSKDNHFVFIGWDKAFDCVTNELQIVARYQELSDSVIVHRGEISTNETWTADKVHLIVSETKILSDVRLLIDRNAVVKFMPGAELRIVDGGECIARGVVFTHVNDDAIGGDTLMDGDSTRPRASEYSIRGTLIDDDATEYRYRALTLEISNLKARQRHPWNGLVDIDCDVVCSDPMVNILLYVNAKDTVTGKSLAVRSVWLENDATHTNALEVKCGNHRLVWDAGADNPGIVSDAVSVEVRTYTGEQPYMVVDLSGGNGTQSYPVSYLDDVPAGGWSDEYKTTKIVLRRIPAGHFTMGSASDEIEEAYMYDYDEYPHEVTISSPFYMGVFEITQDQWCNVMGSNTSSSSCMPVERVTYSEIRGASKGSTWPLSCEVDAMSFIGKLRSRAKDFTWDLPTEAQWEYACRAGTTTAFNNGSDSIWGSGISWETGGEGHEIDGDGALPVGCYPPNAWGLYDMHGNAWEWCLDWYQENLGTSPVVDPTGPVSGSVRVRRGGSWIASAFSCRSAFRSLFDPYDAYNYTAFGFRIATAVPNQTDSFLVCSAQSTLFRLDARKGSHISASGIAETVFCSSRWGNAENCVISVDDEIIKTVTGEGVFKWMPNGVGVHTLSCKAGDVEYSALFTVLGNDVVTHAGALSTNETWSADKVHLVVATVTVPSGVLLVIEPGAVVKFMPGTSLVVENSGTCTAIGVVFTHVSDDTVQGDTLFDGDAPPVQDDYKITGNIIDDDTTEYRYMAPQELTGSIATSIRLRGHRVYVISTDVTVANGATLTIQPGAILKFASGKSLTVNSGGTLNAQGTRSLPIVFTSVKDDSAGGDTNADGDTTYAESGDWGRINVGGTANMNYCTIRYCNNTSDKGAIQGTGGSVTFDNGVIEYSVYECVRMASGGGRFVSHNSVFRESSMGFGWYAGSGIFVYNGVVADCTIGCRASGKYFYNTVFYRVKTFFESGSADCSHCMFYNPDEEGYAQACSKVGANGNIWGDPLFTEGNYRIAMDSPCIDAGDGTVAPKTDYFGQTRQTVYEDAKGTPDAKGKYPDIGIHEVMPLEVKSDVDLSVESVSVPEQITVGQEMTVSWTVKNLGSETASGSWVDKVELVCANGSVVSAGSVATCATLPADGSRTFSGTFTVPSAQVGAVRIRVTANANRDIFEGTLTANNSAESEAATLTMPELAFSDSSAASFNVSAGGSVGYRLGDRFAEGGLLIVHAESAKAGGVKVWTGNGQVPTADIFYAAAVEVGGGGYLVRVPAGGDAYVAFANEGSGIAKVEVGTEAGAFLLFDTGVVTAPNAGTASLTLFGNGFDDGMEVWIEKGGMRVGASEVVIFDPVKAVATFDVTGLAAGAYEVHVKKGDAEAAVTLLSITETRIGPKWSCKLDIASSVRSSREYVGYLEYANTGDMPLDAPYVKITSGSGSFIRFGTADAWGDTLELMATSETYPASQLKPGESRRIPFRYKTTGSSLSVECGYTQDDPGAFPWDTNASYMRPSWASDELWSLSLAVLKSNVGATWNDYLARMRANCDHLAKIGQPTYRLDRIWQLEINEALGVDHAVSTLASNTDLARSGRGFGLALSRSYGSGLYRRLRKGVFGYGWSDNYSAYAELQNSGATLALHSGSGSTYLFEKVNGKWTPEDARDKTTCTESSSEYVLTYRSGTMQRIAKSNMRVSSVTDNQGNSLTFTYNADKQLVKVEHCDGQSLSFTYAGGLLASATDDQGRTTRYEYSGDMLVKVTAFNGLSTQYRYLPADGSVTSRALRQIAYADGTTRDFTYGADGFVATMANNGDKQMTQIAHMGVGEYSITAPNGGVSSSVVGWAGEQLQSVNALNEKTTVNYTADGMLDSLIGSTGKRAKVSYDEDGQMVKSVDAGGVETGFGSTSDYGRLSSVTDARGNVFKYGYDNKGRLISIEYADGFLARIKYSDRGVITNSVNRRGQSISYTYDREGRMLSKVWENGRTFTWAYNGKGNCTNATDSLTGTVTMEYDENERLVRIVHPKGRGFAYTYDSLGRTTSRTTLTGGSSSSATAADIQKYEYDSLGRLFRMTDGDGNLYVEKKYDETTGWLIMQVK